MYKGIAIGVSLLILRSSVRFQTDVNGVQGQGHLVEEEPEEERDHDGDAGGGVGKKPAGLLDKGHLSVG